MTVLYFGNDSSVTTALNTANFATNSGSTIKSTVEGIVSANGGNINDFSFEIEATQGIQASTSYKVVTLGEADVNSSGFFGGQVPSLSL